MEIISLLFLLGTFNSFHFMINDSIKMGTVGVIFNLILVVIWLFITFKPIGY